GDLRRDRWRRHGGRAAPTARRGPGRPRRGDGAAQHRRRAQDARRGCGARGSDGDDPRIARCVPYGGRAMSVVVRVSTILRTYAGGASEVTVDGGTLAEVVSALDAAHPGIGGRVLDDEGRLRRFVNVYVGDEDVRFAEGLATATPDGSVV